MSIAASLAHFVTGRRRGAAPAPRTDPAQDAITRWRDAEGRIETLQATLAAHAEGMTSDDEIAAFNSWRAHRAARAAFTQAHADLAAAKTDYAATRPGNTPAAIAKAHGLAG